MELTPFLTVKDARGIVEFYKKAFGATELSRQSTPTGQFIIEMSIDGERFFVLLDCFAEAELVLIVKKLAQATTEEANWLLADFCVPVSGIARLRAGAWLAAMYLFFRLAARIQDRLLSICRNS